MGKENILVLMSTYNGEKFLLDQLESIANQEDVNVHCLIRDDGSIDKTCQLLSKFCNTHQNFEFYCGKNIGVVKSFNELICNELVDNYDWICFSDQDDVWLNRKLICAINILAAEHAKDIPLLYCSNLTLVNEKLQKIGFKWNTFPKFNKTTALIQNVATGCTEVFNHSAVEFYRKGLDSHMEFHDYWMFLVCIYMGKVIFDFNSQILYRQHNSNVVGARKKTITSAIKHLTENRGIRQLTLTDFIRHYSTSLTNREIATIKRIINYKKSLASRILLVLLPKYKGSSWKVTFGFKIRALAGKIY